MRNGEVTEVKFYSDNNNGLIDTIPISNKEPDEKLVYDLDWNQLITGFDIETNSEQKVTRFEPIIIE